MKAWIPSLGGLLVLGACAADMPPPKAAAPATPAPVAQVHTRLTPGEVKWSPAPPSIPKGAQVAVLHGDPSKPELFVMRLKFPKGYVIPPHSHPATEIVTVVSGTFRLGEGTKADRATAKPLPAGSFFAYSPGMVHYAFSDTESVVQISTMGPWGLTYANAADDPRNKK